MDLISAEAYLYRLLSESIGLDMSDPNLEDTPKRVAKMYQELFKNVGIDYPEEDFRKFPNDENYSQIVMVRNIHFTSMCSHHFLPFTGKAFFAYIPDSFLVGVSKMPRLVEHYSARPQLQENLCHQIMNRFVEVIKPKGAILVMKAVHGCMSCRGVKQFDDCDMVTSVIYGDFENQATREEAMSLMSI